MRSLYPNRAGRRFWPVSWFWPAVAAIALTLAAVQLVAAHQESQIWDEGFEIVAGYQYLTTGVYRASLENPPLERILEALPILYIHPELEGQALLANNTGEADVNAGIAFLYKNHIPGDEILFAARLPMIAVSVALVLVIAAWTRKKFGSIAALAAALLFSLDPTVIAHGHYVKNDMTVTALAFVAVIAWDWFLETGKRSALIWSGIALGFALGSKYSALFLFPVFLILYLLREWRQFSWSRFLKAFVAVSVLAAVIILLLYAPYDADLLPHSRASIGTPLRDVIDQSTVVGRRIAWIGSRLGWRAHPYLVGLGAFASHGGGTHPAYILGNRGNAGWWYYFPFAFAVKTPIAVLVALLIAIPFTLTQPLLLIPILVYGVLSMAGHVDIGLRHLLPIYPFLYVAIASAIARISRFRTPILLAILAGTALESFSVFPYYTAFFNVLAGGPLNGPKLLVDSNIDWGQDLKRLGRFVAARDSPKICIMYFGTAPTWQYLRDPANFPKLEEMRQGVQPECELAAVSVTPLEGVYVDPEWFGWLRNLPPLARIGYSIYVWDVHDPAFQRAYAAIAHNPR